MLHRPHRLLLLAGMVLWFTTSCASVSGGTLGFTPVAARKLPPAGAAPARVLLNEQHIRFELTPDGPVAVTTIHRQAQVLGAAGQRETDVVTGYSATFEKVEQFDARVTDAEGRTLRTYGRRDASDTPGFEGFVLYADSRMVSIDVPDVLIGHVVESVIRKRMKSPELFAFDFGFDEDVPVQLARLVVDVPDGFDIEHVAMRGGEPIDGKPTVERIGAVTRYTWQRGPLTPMVQEEHAPAFQFLREQVAIRLASWVDAGGARHVSTTDPASLSRFTHALMEPRSVPTPAIEQRTREILAGVPDEPRARARRLYAWTRDNIRYCAVQIGMGGWVPHGAADVEKVRYGDCKDKANLLKSMLQVAGIPSRMVTIYADMYPKPYLLPVLAGNFNHAILVVDLPDGPVWVDPTTRTTPFDDLPPVDEDRLALPASARGDGLTPSPPSDPLRERVVAEASLTMDAAGVGRGTVQVEANGAFADALRDDLLSLPAGEHDSTLTRFVPIQNMKVEGATFVNAAAPEEVTPVRARARVEARIPISLRPGADALLSSSALTSLHVPFVNSKRQLPVLLQWRQSRALRTTVELPPGTLVARVPEAVDIDTPHLHYTRRWKNDGTRLVLEREVTYKVRLVPIAELGTYAEAAAQIARAEDAKVILRAP